MGKYNFVFGVKEGKKHIDLNIPCQDSAICIEKNGVVAAVLSDGCGSAALSHYGSKITVNSFANFLADNFVELAKGFDLNNKGNATLATKKKMVRAIIDAQLDFVRSHKQLFYDTFPEQKEKFEKDENCLSELYGTLIFYAEKENVAIYGQIGDGVLGLVEKDVLKITLEEAKKSGKTNVTVYPWDIERLSQTHEQKDKWFGQCRFRLMDASDIKGAFLTSDGVDACFDTRVAFKKKYIGVAGLFTSLKSADETTRKMIVEKTLTTFQQRSRERDDVSFVALFTDDCDIKMYETKEYPVYQPKPKDAERTEITQNKEPELERQVGNLNVPEVDRELVKKYYPLAKEQYDDVEIEVFEKLITGSSIYNEKLAAFDKNGKNYIKDTGFDNEDVCKHYVELLKILKENNDVIRMNLFTDYLVKTNRLAKLTYLAIIELIDISDEKIEVYKEGKKEFCRRLKAEA